MSSASITNIVVVMLENRSYVLNAEKFREQGQLDRLQQEVGELKLELTASVTNDDFACG